MKFVPYNKVTSVPNVIIDGAATENTVLTLSHWPKSGTPHALKGDTSTEAVFKYLDSPQFHVHADAFSNDHFDEDGLAGMLAFADSACAERYRDLLVDVAQAGDFGVYGSRDAARIAFTLSAYANADSSPLDGRVFAQPYADVVSDLYPALLELLPKLLAKVTDYQRFWEDEDARLAESERLIDNGAITIDERPDFDLAVVRVPDTLSVPLVRRFTQPRVVECHPFAIHTRTALSRIVLLQGPRIELQYRYESWVQMVSRRPAPRVDLSSLADELNQEEESGGRWVFEPVDRITPRLHLQGNTKSSTAPDVILERIEAHLRTGAPAWDPYD